MLTKLQNVLIASFTPIEITIADFGISSPHHTTYLQTMCGTRSYQAPEQLGLLPQGFQSKRGYTKAVDIWALGVLLFQMLTSKLPFQAENTSSIFYTGDLTLVTERDREPTMDFAILIHYCHGLGLFPMESLLGARTSTQGVAFLNCLLAPKPKERVSAKNAQQHPWITGYDGTLGWLARVLRRQFLSLEHPFPDGMLEDCVERGTRLRGMMEHLQPLYATTLVTTRILEKALRLGYREVYTILRTFIGIDWKKTEFPLLTLAAAGGHSDAISLLLNSGARIDGGPGHRHGRIALPTAAERGHLDPISLVLSKGADVNATAAFYSGIRPLAAAAKGGHLDAISLLLSNGADVNAVTFSQEGSTALETAALGGYLATVNLLLANGADVNTVAYGTTETALQHAVKRGKISAEQLQLILSQYDKVNE